MRFERDTEGNKTDHTAWSCCLNEDPNAEGCNRYVVDKKKWNLISYTYKWIFILFK